MISIFISNNIQITGLEDKYIEHLKKALTLDNPMYYKLMNMAKRDSSKRGALYACPQYFQYFTMNGEVLIIPRGMRVRLLSFLDKVGVEYQVKMDFIFKPLTGEFKKSFDGDLRDHQKSAINVVDDNTNEGIFLMGTGTGKTVVGLELIMKKGGTATILVPNTALLDQWKNELKDFYGIEASTIYAKEKKVSGITIATFQSLYEYTKICKELIENTSTLIVDEVHGAVSKEKTKVISRFRPTNIFGITATPNREDKQGDAINFYFGNTLFEHHPTQANPIVEIIRTNVDIDVDEYPVMIEEMVENENRNRLITGLVTGELFSTDRKILVLTKRVAHAETLYKTFSNNTKCYLISSKDKNRNELLSSLKQGTKEFRVIFGTTALLSVGVDIPSLDTLIMCSDIKAETLLIQSSGRILRLFEGKEDPKIIDLWDNRNPILTRQFYARKRVYDARNWAIKGLDK